jgi:hypothetical protein
MASTAKSHECSIRIASVAWESPAADEAQRAYQADRVQVQIADGSMTPALDFYAASTSEVDAVSGCDLDDIRALARRCYLAGVADAGGDVAAAEKALEAAGRAALAELEAAGEGASLSVELEGDAA